MIEVTVKKPDEADTFYALILRDVVDKKNIMFILPVSKEMYRRLKKKLKLQED